MNKKPVLVIAEHHFHEFYNALSISDERIEVVRPNESSDFIINNGADVVLIDCGANASKGFAIIEEIKSLRSDVPVIFLTDIASSDITVKAYRTGARICFEKPVNFFELRGTVENMIKTKRASREVRTDFVAFENTKTDGPVCLIDSDVPAHIIKSVLYIEDNVSSLISLDDLANTANLSKYHFCRLFKKCTGLSPLEFVKIIRINKAKELLRRKNYSVSSVAEEVGFNDLSNFERQFKLLTGITPSSYRKRLRRK